MSQPRRITPDTVYLITRRCSEGRYFLHPDEETNRAFLFCLLVAALRSDVGIVAALAQLNQWDGVVFDRMGRLPEFLHHFHAMLARHQNALRGRSDNMWSSQQTSVVELLDPDDIVEQTARVLAGPVRGQLVQTAEQWVGVSTLDALRSTGRLTASRPARFFRGPANAPVALELTVPPGFTSRAEFAARVDTRIAQLEEEAQAARLQSGKSVVGNRRIARLHWNESPKRDPRAARRTPSSSAATTNRAARAAALGRNREWVDAYGRARRRFVAGDRAVVFPKGTYWLARHGAVRVASGSNEPIFRRAA